MTLADWIEDLRQMGWYLDTSLIMDFIQTNVRKGFEGAEERDGNTIFRVEGLKAGRHIFVPVVRGNMRFAFELTTTMDELRALQSSYGTRFYYSELTKAEVFRSLRKAHSGRPARDIEDWWKAFISLLQDFQKVSVGSSEDEQLSRLALDFPIRKNVQDYLHLITAKSHGLAFITSDRLDGQIEDLRTSYYGHVYYWPDLRREVFGDDVRSFWHLGS